MLDKILNYTGKIFTIAIITSMSIATVVGAMYAVIKFLQWLGEVM